jgi:hypothetical protein
MRRSPSVVPTQPDNVDVYLVLDDFGGWLGRAWRETDEDSTDRCTVITDLLDGHYFNPVRVVAFNTGDGWSRDVSEELADEIVQQCAQDGDEVPLLLQGFVDRHGNGRPVQLALPLIGAA